MKVNEKILDSTLALCFTHNIKTIHKINVLAFCIMIANKKYI